MALHKTGGRIIIFFFGLHSLGYSGVFIQSHMFGTIARQPQMMVAIMSAAIFLIIGATTISAFRLRRYSLFHRIHYVGSIIAIVLLFFHNSYIRMYLVESLVVLFLKYIVRTWTTVLKVL